MTAPDPRDAKTEALRQHGVLHPRPEAVTDEQFRGNDFFDARDLMQVKYEMLRRWREAGLSVTASAAAFGLSRPTFYEARRALREEGLAGFLPRKRGPRGGHKVTEEVVEFLEGQMAGTDRPTSRELARRVRTRFGFTVHWRTIERALARRGKARG